MKAQIAAHEQLLNSPMVKAQIEALNSPTTKAMFGSFERLNESPAMRAVAESLERINQMAARPSMDLRIPDLDSKLTRLATKPEVALLEAVHSQLVGMANLLTAGAKQTAEMAEVTKANLTAVHAVVEELREGRRDADRWNRTLTRWNRRLAYLTLAILAATVVGAIAVGPEFARQIAAWSSAGWSWVQSLPLR
jgi:hypothetical protein